MKRLLSYSVVMFVITIILLLIIPLPAGLVDVAIILNMSLSMMILVITMTIREPLEFSIFPSLLLITTLFRWSSPENVPWSYHTAAAEVHRNY